MFQPAQEGDGAYADALAELFPCNDSAHLEWVNTFPGGSKRARTIHTPPTSHEFLRHLDLESMAGPGALGVMFARSTEEGRTCRVIALDLDTRTVAQLKDSPYITTLKGCGVHPYVTTGSTGRGSHMYVFLEQDVPTSHAYMAARALANILRETDEGLAVEVFPSSATNQGKGIFLPYRGAAGDGFGVNPLLDPDAGFAPIPLDSAASRLVRTSAEDLFRLAESAPTPDRIATQGSRTHSVVRTSEPEEVFDSEVARLAKYWRRGVRNSLVKGLAAYAFDGLGVDTQVILEGIRKLHRNERAQNASSDDDEAELVVAALRTFERCRQGKRVAWYCYYSEAGAPPPAPVGRDSQTVHSLLKLRRQLATTEFAGATRLNDRALYETVVRLAHQFGRRHPRGIAVRVSRRDLAMRANLGDKGAQTALKRLKSRGLVASTRSPLISEPWSLTAIVKPLDANEDTQSTPPSIEGGTVQDWGPNLAHPAFRRRYLGQVSGLIVQQLHRHGPLTKHELAKSLKRRPYLLNRSLELLSHHDVVTQGAGNYTLAPDFDVRLGTAAEAMGANRARARQKEWHVAERADFERWLETRKPHTPGAQSRQS